MIGLDTNVVVRYIMQDDTAQADLATALIESLTPETRGFISIVTLVEVSWVLQRSYKLAREEIAEVIDGLLSSRQLVIEKKAEAYQALSVFKTSKADFADSVIERLGADAGCSMTYTFDKRASQHAGMMLLAAEAR